MKTMHANHNTQVHKTKTKDKKSTGKFVPKVFRIL